MKEQDYYQLLGLSSNVTDADIKKAYRRAAMRWHPDKNPENLEEANSMFKQVGEAYEVLSDPEKRRLYDQGGKEGLSGSGRSRGDNFHARFHDPFSVFEQFFGGRDPFEEMFADRSRRHMRTAPGGFSNFFGRDPFGGFSDMGGSDPFGGFGDMGGGDPFGGFGDLGAGGAPLKSRSSSGGGRGMTSTTTTTTTTTMNGKRVTVTEKVVRKADGTTETTRTESQEGGGRSGDMLGRDTFFDGSFGNDRRSLMSTR